MNRWGQKQENTSKLFPKGAPGRQIWIQCRQLRKGLWSFGKSQESRLPVTAMRSLSLRIQWSRRQEEGETGDAVWIERGGKWKQGNYFKFLLCGFDVQNGNYSVVQSSYLVESCPKRMWETLLAFWLKVAPRLSAMAPLRPRLRTRSWRGRAQARMESFSSASPLCQWTCLNPVTSLGGFQRSSPGPGRGQEYWEVCAI